MMRGSYLSLVISLVLIVEAVQLFAQKNEAGTSNEPFNFIVMVMGGDDAGMFDFNVLLDLQRKWFDYQGWRADLERQFNNETQQLLKDYSNLAAAFSRLTSAPMLGSPDSVLADHFETAYNNLTAKKQEKAHALLERYNLAVADYLTPKGEQATAYARTLISVSVGVYSQFVMRLGAYLSQLDASATSCAAHYADNEDFDITCFKREVKILEDFIYQLILKSTTYLDEVRKIPSATTSNFPTTTTTTTTTEITSTPPTTTSAPPTTTTTSTPSSVTSERATLGSPAPLVGSGSGDVGDEETTKLSHPHLLPPDDEDSQQEPSAKSDSSKATQAQPSTTQVSSTGTTPTGNTPVSTTMSTVGSEGTVLEYAGTIVVTEAIPVVAHQDLPLQLDTEQAMSSPSAVEHVVETKGRHGQDKGTQIVDGSITIVSGSGQPSNGTSLADLSVSYGPMFVVVVCCAAGMLSIVVSVTVVCSVLRSRRNRQRAKGRVPLTEEELVENMKKDGFVNPTYTFFSK